MMKKTFLLAATAMALASAGSADAATLINAAVTGSGGATVWNTTNDDFYTLFLQANNGPGSPVINPTSAQQPISVPITGSQSFLINGEGFPASTNAPGTTAPNSDPAYNLTLTFLNSNNTQATLSGTYTILTNLFAPTSGPVSLDGTLFSLADFSWTRDRGDPVQAFTATPGGDPNDYHGNFQLTASVPEPATWAMMLVGFGFLGLAMRRRGDTSVAGRIRFA